MNKSQLSIHHYEWFDKVNGNSYFSVSAILTVFKTPNMVVNYKIVLPFQYGYGSHYEYILANAIETLAILPKSQPYGILWKLADDNNVEIIENVTHEVTKKVAKEIGEWNGRITGDWDCISSGLFKDHEVMAWRNINITEVPAADEKKPKITLTGTFVDRDDESECDDYDGYDADMDGWYK